MIPVVSLNGCLHLLFYAVYEDSQLAQLHAIDSKVKSILSFVSLL